MQAAHIKSPSVFSHGWLHLISLVLLSLIMTGCSGIPLSGGNSISVTIKDSQQIYYQEGPEGTSVQAFIDKAGVTLGELDRVDPPTYTILNEPTVVQITRVTETFEIEEKVIPYERQSVRNESLTEGEQYLIQPGINGLQQLTYRRIFENGIEKSRALFDSTISIQPQSEIIMIGVQTPVRPIPIPGKLAYLSGGNAWLMEEDTGYRVPLVTTGDLDGRIFTISPDGSWLLFTRHINDAEPMDINSLWLVNLKIEDASTVNLRISNVIHFAGWAPDNSQTIYYSTVEPRATAPGWQANNNLQMILIGSDGLILSQNELIEPNSGGIYGWWGTDFLWSPDGTQLAYTRPDSVGLIDFENGRFNTLVEIIPYQTLADWAWVPGIAWSADSQLLYLVTHEKGPGSANNETSPIFNLTSIDIYTGQVIPLVQQTGMFAQPQFSPRYREDPLRLAYLEAIFPEQSDTSRSRLVTMDQDGSNRQAIFPPEGSTGLDPQEIVWSPSRQNDQPRYLAFIYHGNIWLINSETGKSHQVTGDGLISRIDWQ